MIALRSSEVAACSILISTNSFKDGTFDFRLPSGCSITSDFALKASKEAFALD